MGPTILSGLTRSTATRTRLAFLFGILVTLKAIDGFWTLWATNHGYIELNPIMASIASTWWGPVATTLPLVVLGILVMGIIRRFPGITKVVFHGVMAACVLMIVVLVTNLGAIIE